LIGLIEKEAGGRRQRAGGRGQRAGGRGQEADSHELSFTT